jgi:peptidylprolyl isomerase
VLVLAALVSGACANVADPASGGSPSPSPRKPIVTVPAGPPPTTLVVSDLTEGTGRAAVAGDSILVHYVGVAFSTGEEFDSSWGGESLPVTLGTGGVIRGWDEGLPGMKVGGRRQLIIPPDLAYGPEGYPGLIGPNETLIFVVDLVRIQPA